MSFLIWHNVLTPIPVRREMSVSLKPLFQARIRAATSVQYFLDSTSVSISSGLRFTVEIPPFEELLILFWLHRRMVII